MQTEPGAEVTCWLHGHQEDADPSELCGAFDTVPKLPFRNRRWVRSLSALALLLLCGQEHRSRRWPSLPPFLLQVTFSVAICCFCPYVPEVARHFTAFGSGGFILLQHVMMHAGCGAAAEQQLQQLCSGERRWMVAMHTSVFTQWSPGHEGSQCVPCHQQKSCQSTFQPPVRFCRINQMSSSAGINGLAHRDHLCFGQARGNCGQAGHKDLCSSSSRGEMEMLQAVSTEQQGWLQLPEQWFLT